jgi:Holliday junction resolvase RusA-like endonuclease
MIEIELPNMPVPWSIGKGKKGKIYSPHAKDKIWTQWQIKSLYTGEPLPGFIVLDLTFIEPPPLSATKGQRELMMANIVRPIRCDNTNCQKFMEDCLKNICFLDDRYVCKNISEKLYGDKGKILIKIWTLQEYKEKHANNT